MPSLGSRSVTHRHQVFSCQGWNTLKLRPFQLHGELGGGFVSLLSGLQPAERIERYRAFADEARRQAAQTRDDFVRDSYLFVADQWDRLARDMADRHHLPLVVTLPRKR